jgi:hypothetical protein
MSDNSSRTRIVSGVGDQERGTVARALQAMGIDRGALRAAAEEAIRGA